MKMNMTINFESVNEFATTMNANKNLFANMYSCDITFDDSKMRVKMHKDNENTSRFNVTFADLSFDGTFKNNERDCFTNNVMNVCRIYNEIGNPNRANYDKVSNVSKDIVHLTFADVTTFIYVIKMTKLPVKNPLNIVIDDEIEIDIETNHKDGHFHFKVSDYNTGLSVSGKMKTDHDWKTILKFLNVNDVTTNDDVNIAA